MCPGSHPRSFGAIRPIFYFSGFFKFSKVKIHRIFCGCPKIMKFGQEGGPIFPRMPAKFHEKIRSGGPKKNLCWLAKKYIILWEEGKSAYSSLGGRRKPCPTRHRYAPPSIVGKTTLGFMAPAWVHEFVIRNMPGQCSRGFRLRPDRRFWCGAKKYSIFIKNKKNNIIYYF